MSLLQRQDGQAFTLRPYRELLTQKSSGLLKNEIRLLAQTNGHFLRLFKLKGGQYEAVFAREPGHLLGETIWHHFGKPTNLIFCEALEEDLVAVVIVKDAMVYLDAKLPESELQDELTSISAASDPYEIKLCGYPLDKFTLDITLIASEQQFDDSIIETISLSTEFQLLAVEQAINAANIGKIKPYFYIPAVLGILLIGWWFWPQSLLDQVKVAPQSSPLQQFQHVLRTPSVRQQLQIVLNDLQTAFLAPGWMVTQLHFKANKTRLHIRSLGGSTHDLIAWAQQQQSSVSLTQSGAYIEMSSNLPNRQPPSKPTRSLRTLSNIIDRMMLVIPGKSVSIHAGHRYPLYKTTAVVISFDDVSLDVLGIISEELAGLPINLQTVELSVNEGLLSGKIDLNMIGS